MISSHAEKQSRLTSAVGSFAGYFLFFLTRKISKDLIPCRLQLFFSYLHRRRRRRRYPLKNRTMRKLDPDKIIIYAVSILLVIALSPLLSRLPRSRGKNPIYHGIFVVAAGLLLAFLPEEIQHEVFSPGGVVVLGTVLPIYESIVAVCTPGEQDDTVWLQFWIASGTFSYCTEFVDEIKHVFPQGECYASSDPT